MRVGVYYPENDAYHSAALLAFHDGVRAVGADELVFDTVEGFADDVDVAVVFGTRKKAVPYSEHRGKIIRAMTSSGKRAVIIERGYVDRDDHYAVGYDGLNGRADFCNAGARDDRWLKLGRALQPWKKPRGKTYLVVGQVPWDASVQHIDFVAWCSNVVAVIQNLDPRSEIVFRPHPLALEKTPYILGTERSEGPLEHDLEHADIVVTFNSNVGVDAAIAGVPVVALDAGSMIWGRAPDRLDAETLWWDRKQWANEIAYAQWTLDEMSWGAAWKHLRPHAVPGKAAA